MRTWRVLASAALAATTCSCDEGADGVHLTSPRLRVEPPSLAFGVVAVGEPHTLSVHLRNEGGSVLHLHRVTLATTTGEFSLIGEPAHALAPTESADLIVQYTPSWDGEATASITLAHDDDSGPTTIPITGRGGEPDLKISTNGEPCGTTPGSVSFGTVAIGQRAERTITLEAVGREPVDIRFGLIAHGASAEWSLDPLPPEGITLAPGQAHALRAIYAPADAGTDAAELVFGSNSDLQPTLRVPACGEGAQPAICASPIPLDLGSAPLGVRTEGALHIWNCSDHQFNLDAVTIAADPAHPSDPGFRIDEPIRLPQTLRAGEGIDVNLSFASLIVGRATGYIRAETNAQTLNEAYFPIGGEARDTCQILVTPDHLDYNPLAPGLEITKRVLIANNGADTCAVVRAEVTSGGEVYSIAEPPPFPHELASGTSLDLIVRYRASARGAMDTGVLEIQTGARVERVALNGNADPPEGCLLDAQPEFINFGLVAAGEVALRGIDLRNVSESVCYLGVVTLDPASDPAFTGVQSAPGSIAPGERTTIVASYRAPAGGTSRGLVHIESNDVVAPVIDVELFAAVAPPSICVEPRDVDFGTIAEGDADVTIRACGASEVTVAAVHFTRSDPEISLPSPPAAPFVLQPGEQRVVAVRYTSADDRGDTAILSVESNDRISPSIDVRITAGPEIVPRSAGRYLYYWAIDSLVSQSSNILRLPLQGDPTPEPFWGPMSGRACTGCHSVSPDGRYVAMSVDPNFSLTVVDTRTGTEVLLPFSMGGSVAVSWKPDVTSTPPYQFAYAAEGKIHLASLFAGYIGEVQGANDPIYGNNMPSWGPNGKIAFARGESSSGTGFFGASDIMLVDETGGVAVPLNGASANGGANYYPSYHPSGDWVAFNHSAEAESTSLARDARIWMVRTDQSGAVFELPEVNCPPGQCASSLPTWSVDGTYLAFSSDRPGSLGLDLYLAPIDPLTGTGFPAQRLMETASPSSERGALWGN